MPAVEESIGKVMLNFNFFVIDVGGKKMRLPCGQIAEFSHTSNTCDCLPQAVGQSLLSYPGVWHKGLLFKMQANGIWGKLLNGFTYYFSNRTQAVVITGEKSDFKTIPASVP